MFDAVAQKPFYVRVGLTGIWLFFLLGVVIGPFIIAIGDWGSLIFLTMVAYVPVLLMTFLILRFGNWAYVVSTLLCLLGLLFSLPSISEGLSNPDSFFDFGYVVVGMVGLVIGVVGFTVAFFQARSGRASASGSPAAVMAVKGIVGLIAVLSIASIVLTVTGMDSVSAKDKEGATLVKARTSEWSIDSIEVNSGRTLKLLIKNSDPYVHTFTVDDLNIDYTVGPGSEKLIVLDNLAAGTYEFRCTITGHDNMKGTITIE